MTAILDNYRPTIGLSDGEIMCRECGGDGVAYHVSRRAVQIANLDRRPRTGRNRGERTHCWLIGRAASGHRPLARIILQWSAHGHYLLTDHPELEVCHVCQGMGVLVPRRPR